jgi:hypothetical protein
MPNENQPHNRSRFQYEGDRYLTLLELRAKLGGLVSEHVV